MTEEELFKILYDKNKVDNYRKFQEIENSIEDDNHLYQYFNKFLKMLNNEKSYIRIRGFRLICKLAKYDINKDIDKNIDKILDELDDSKPTNVRQCLSYINNLLLYKPNLSKKIAKKLNKFDYDKYNDSMIPLIKKDIEYVLNHL